MSRSHAMVFEILPSQSSNTHPEGAILPAIFSRTVTTCGCCVYGYPAQLLLVLFSVYFSLDTAAFDFLLPMKGYP